MFLIIIIGKPHCNYLIGGVQVEGAAGVVVEAELEALLRERHGEDGQGCGEDYHEDECC